MTEHGRTTNIVFAGLGGTGVIRASDIMAGAAFRTGCDVKKSEVHGMSQRGGSVASDVRFGAQVLSPMTPAGEADFLVVLHATQVAVVRHYLAPHGVLITTDVLFAPDAGPKTLDDDPATPVTSRNYNVALLGLLSTYLAIGESAWHAAIEASLPEKVQAQNVAVFSFGQTLRAMAESRAREGV